jgi:putative hemolysin
MEHLGNNFPKKGHMIIWDGFSFELIRVKNYEIKEVKIKSVNGDHIRSSNGETEITTEKNKEELHKALSAK